MSFKQIELARWIGLGGSTWKLEYKVKLSQAGVGSFRYLAEGRDSISNSNRGYLFITNTGVVENSYDGATMKVNGVSRAFNSYVLPVDEILTIEITIPAQTNKYVKRLFGNVRAMGQFRGTIYHFKIINETYPGHNCYYKLSPRYAEVKPEVTTVPNLITNTVEGALTLTNCADAWVQKN